MKYANIPGCPNVPMNVWGKSTLLLGLLYREGLLPDCSIYSVEGDTQFEINGIKVGATEEEVTTCIWFMVESFAAEGHIDFRDNPTVAEAASEALEA